MVHEGSIALRYDSGKIRWGTRRVSRLHYRPAGQDRYRRSRINWLFKVNALVFLFASLFLFHAADIETSRVGVVQFGDGESPTDSARGKSQLVLYFYRHCIAEKGKGRKVTHNEKPSCLREEGRQAANQASKQAGG